jgi:chromosome segregation protein
MRLQRLEINGFKSFSDRSELAFDQGVTAIVGPNGCGKSNVADAITWVMGEQSAKSLRGDRMEDVIFSGSDARKPTATAEVRLRFTGVVKHVAALERGEPVHAEGGGHEGGNGATHEAAHEQAGSGNGRANGYVNGRGNGHGNGNGHGDLDDLIRSVTREVEVTRRLYRSGESEYLIDGQSCRLRDIHDLLMDTGLGAKAYAIIEQGKIGLILSTRPTDRRQLIEEAAGVTKYRARRRAAALKLEAAQQNLTRIDDIVFEVEKQRGTLKRQAAKARRYRKLRDELKRLEKVLFARKYRLLGETIASGHARLAEARERESVASGSLAEFELQLARQRIELADAEARATAAREAAHEREIELSRLQQQLAFDSDQVRILGARVGTLDAEIESVRRRREPASALLASRKAAVVEGNTERDRAAAALAAESGAYETMQLEIEGLEADVEAARSEVFSAINAATALRHSLEHAGMARDRVAEVLTRLGVEENDLEIEFGRVAAERSAAADALNRAQASSERTRAARIAREAELSRARMEHEQQARSFRAREHDLAGLEARLTSLEELEAARAGFGDAARMVLAQANGKVNQQGAIADYLEVAAGYERAVEACLGDLLQHVVVEQPEYASEGLQLVRENGAGRCGFLITSAVQPAAHLPAAGSALEPFGDADGLVALSSVVKVTGPYAAAIRTTIGDALIAGSYERGAQASGATQLPVGTLNGDLFRGPHVVAGGSRDSGRGILETKREIKELRERLVSEREALQRLAAAIAALEGTIADASGAIAALNAEQHQEDKAIVAHEARLRHASEEALRLDRRRQQLLLERRQNEEERDALDRRQDEARASIVRLDEEQLLADERLTTAQRRLFEARETAQDVSRRSADAGAAHAALVERAHALALEVERLLETLTEIEARESALAAERLAAAQRAERLAAEVAEGQARLDTDVRALEEGRGDVHLADAAVSARKEMTDAQEGAIRSARAGQEEARARVAELDVARATAESDLGHLAETCLDSVQATLDDVLQEVTELERDGEIAPDARILGADDPSGDGADDQTDDPDSAVPVAGETVADDGLAAHRAAEERTLSAEEAIAALRSKIDHLGPVNMMAIEQFDELETRHVFLTTQRKDLLDSIMQTSEAIERIDETTRRRFLEAFAAINRNFQDTFSTLFGGGRAGLTLLDENDPLETGIEIIAQPPGKRLQSVQLLSGGEKALSAISLMFALFKYKPSPFCLLDEIDAPLDDANIGRFVEMLRSMQQHTQFILITHNRKTMEIADRLYGVTMEEPGVSKLISVQLY